MTLSLIILAGVGVLSLIFALPVVRFIERHGEVFVGLIFGLFVFTAALTAETAPSVSLGGISVYPLDLLCPLLLVFATPFVYFRIKEGFSQNDTDFLLLVGLALVFAWNYLLGVREFGIEQATNGFRAYLYFICIALYVATLPIVDLWPKIEKIVLFSAFALVLVALIGYRDGDLSREGRPLAATETLVLIQAFLFAAVAFVFGRLRPFWFLASLGLLPMVLILQHRSVWVVSLVVMAGIYYYLPRLRGAITKLSLIGMIVGSVVVFGFFGEAVFKALTESYEEAVSEESTFVWRVLGWKALLTGEQMDSAREILLGSAFGSGWDRSFVGLSGERVEIEDTMPHNYYIQVLLRGGLWGLLCFGLLYARLMVQTVRQCQHDPSGRGVSVVILTLLASQLVFFIPYAGDTIQAVFLGCAIAVLRHRREFETL